MNAMSSFPALVVRKLDLGDSTACGVVDLWVRQQPGSSPFHLTGWSRAIARGCKQKGHYLVAEALDGRILGVLPLTEVRSRLFGNAMVSVGFAVGGGVLVSDYAVAAQLIDFAVKLAKDRGCTTIELRSGLLPDGWDQNDTSYLGFARDLAADDEAQLLSITRRQRAEVRRGLGFDLDVSVGTSPEDLKGFYQAYSESVRNLGTPVFPRALFTAMIDEFGIEADILTVRKDGKILSSVFTFYFNGSAMPYWGGGGRDARTWRANDVAYYHLMCHARSVKGCTRFDFGRSKVGTGPAAFKKNWGFEGVPLPFAKLSLGDGPARDINPLNPKYQRRIELWQKLPLQVANLIGPFIARELG